MKNIGITKCMNRTVDNFTTDFGIKLRRIVDVVLRPILKLATKRKIIVEYYPRLEKGKPYIFASTHSFDEDIIANLATIDRNAWLLTGATHQVEYNPQFYAAWVHGITMPHLPLTCLDYNGYIQRGNKGTQRAEISKTPRCIADCLTYKMMFRATSPQYIVVGSLKG